MHIRGHVLLVAGMALVAVGLAGGCKNARPETASEPTSEVSNPSDPATVSAADLFVELTYPQSDDQGNYVGTSEGGSVVVAGLVSSPEPIETIYVNGAETTPYVVEQVSAYGAPSGETTYRFHAPVVLQPQDPIVVEVERGTNRIRYTFQSNRKVVTDRWVTLAKASPADPWSQARLGSAYYAQGSYDDAVTHFDKALEPGQDLSWVLYDLGMTYLALDRADQATGYFGRAATVYPAFPDAYYARGLTQYQAGRASDAILDLVHATDVAPGWAEPLLALGLAYYTQRELGQASQYYSQAVTLWPTWPAPHYALGAVWLDQGRDDDGYAMIDRGVRLGPWGKGHHLQLAEKLAAKGNYNAAWRQLQVAEKLGETGEHSFVQRVRSHTSDQGTVDGWPWQAQVAGRCRVDEGHRWYTADIGPAAQVVIRDRDRKRERVSDRAEGHGKQGGGEPGKASEGHGKQGGGEQGKASEGHGKHGGGEPGKASEGHGKQGGGEPSKASEGHGKQGGGERGKSGATGGRATSPGARSAPVAA